MRVNLRSTDKGDGAEKNHDYPLALNATGSTAAPCTQIPTLLEVWYKADRIDMGLPKRQSTSVLIRHQTSGMRSFGSSLPDQEKERKNWCKAWQELIQGCGQCLVHIWPLLIMKENHLDCTSYDDVKTQASSILGRIRTKDMPRTKIDREYFPDEAVNAFERWIKNGTQRKNRRRVRREPPFHRIWVWKL